MGKIPCLLIITLFCLSSILPVVNSFYLEKEINVLETSLDNGLMDSDWPMFHHDVRHTGRSPLNFNFTIGMIKWKLWLGKSTLRSSPVIDKDGIIYVGINPYNHWEETDFYAIYPNGTIKWSYTTEGGIVATPALAEDGTIYVINFYNALFAFNPDGTVKWRVEKPGVGGTSLVIDKDGTVYFCARSITNYEIGYVYAINPDGTEKWYYTVSRDVESSPALDDNNLYLGSTNYFYSISKNGILNWRISPGGSTPAIGDDGTIYYSGDNGNFYALYPNGTKKWNTSFSGSSPALLKNGGIIIGSGHEVISINPDGFIKWRFHADGKVRTPAVDNYGNVYVGAQGDNGGYLYIISSNGSFKWKYRTGDYNTYMSCSPSIGLDGTIYFGFNDGYLYAVSLINDKRPDKPVVSGPTSCKTRVVYNYSASSSDEDGDNLSYFFDWGDGFVDGWTEFIPSGSTINISHFWRKSGSFNITVTAKDIYDNTSKLSDPLTVNVVYGDTGERIYVGGSGPGNYSSIQDGVDAAVYGDTVFVYNGTYYENVVINKNISLIGEDKTTTIIDSKGKGNVIKINHDYVTVSGFTIRNGSGAGIVIFSNYNTISENNITCNKGDGITFSTKYIGGPESCFNLITSNIICDNRDTGIFLVEDYGGIYGWYNTISRNLISNNGWGVVFCWCYGNKFYDNYITHNTWEGIKIVVSNRNIINGNSIEYNGIGINITTVGSGFNVIKNNNLFGNSLDATFEILMIPVYNTWLHNYWGVPKLLPKIIIGTLHYDIDPFDGPEKHMPWVAFDWHPALIPNYISPLEVS